MKTSKSTKSVASSTVLTSADAADLSKLAPLPTDVAPVVDPDKSPLTAEMLAFNAAAKQTKWVNFAGTALCFFKRHVPNAPAGYARYCHLFRNVTGQAWLILRADALPADFVAANETRVEGKDYVCHVNPKGGDVAGALVDEKGRVNVLVRCADYDLTAK